MGWGYKKIKVIFEVIVKDKIRFFRYEFFNVRTNSDGDFDNKKDGLDNECKLESHKLVIGVCVQICDFNQS